MITPCRRTSVHEQVEGEESVAEVGSEVGPSTQAAPTAPSPLRTACVVQEGGMLEDGTHVLRGLTREERRAGSPNPWRAGCTRDGGRLQDRRRSRQRRPSDDPRGVTHAASKSSHDHHSGLPYAVARKPSVPPPPPLAGSGPAPRWKSGRASGEVP